jgi:hypothetical protein
MSLFSKTRSIVPLRSSLVFFMALAVLEVR